jgi:RHS repeat-associated protein
MVQYPNGNQVTYAYDANGNRTAKSEGGNILQSYAYDFENHMVQASGPGGILGTYYYNADGLRVAKTTAAGTVGFIYDAMKLLQEVGATGQTTATYTSTGGRPESGLLGIANSAGSHVPLTDALGSVRLLLDSGQSVSDGYVYEAFGRQVSRSGQTPNPYHFVGAYGYYQDWETGLQLLTARYYDAEVGRFVTRDPIGFGGGDWNIYGYVRNRPVNKVDPSGLSFSSLICLFGCIPFGELYSECEDVCDTCNSFAELGEKMKVIIAQRHRCQHPTSDDDCLACQGREAIFLGACSHCCNAFHAGEPNDKALDACNKKCEDSSKNHPCPPKP